MSSFPLSVMGQEPTGKSQWIYPDASGKLVYKTTKKVIASLIFPMLAIKAVELHYLMFQPS